MKKTIYMKETCALSIPDGTAYCKNVFTLLNNVYTKFYS